VNKRRVKHYNSMEYKQMNHILLKYFKIITAAFLISNFSLAIAESADEIVYKTTREVLNQLEINKQRLEKQPEFIKEIVRNIIVPNMDFDTMSALALGDSWNKLTDIEQACFSNSFKNLLVERYAYILLSYRDQNIHYQSAAPIGEKGYVSIVQTLTSPDAKPLTLEYPMRPDNNDWKVVDLVVDDVSLIRNYRKMFNKEIKHQGFAGFLKNFLECNL
jgi:phospholipid transport system substrate-binding protein